MGVLIAVHLLGCSDQTIGTRNALPEASILVPEHGAQVLQGSQQSFSGVVSDELAVPAELFVSWSSSLDGQLLQETPDAEGVTSFTSDQLSAGEHTITLRVVDQDGASGSDEVLVTVLANSPPEISINQPSIDGSYFSDLPVSLSATVDDSEEGPEALRVQWRMEDGTPLGAALVPDSSGEVNSSTSLGTGSWLLIASAIDSGGMTAEDSVVITVNDPNTAPSCAFSSPSPESLYNPGDVVTLAGTVADPDQDVETLTVELSSSEDGVLGTTTPAPTGSFQHVASNLTTATHILTVTVSDDMGVECSDTLTITLNAPPTAPLISIDPAQPITSDSLQLVIDQDAVDPEGETISYDIRWTLSTTAMPAFDDLYTVPAANTARGDAWEVVVTADDGWHSTLGTASVVVGNTPPTLSGVSISATSTDELGTLTAVAGPTSDPDGQTVTVSWQWQQAAADIVGATTDTLTGSDFDAGDEITVIGTPHDGLEAGPAQTSAPLTILNTLPSTTAPAISPSLIYTNTAVTCGGSPVSDPDPAQTPALELSWELNGSPPIPPVSGPLLPTSYFDKGDSLVCVATPSDGVSSGTPVPSAASTVLNTTPSQPSVGITPTNPIAGEELTCSITTPSSDPDAADTPSYDITWTLAGSSSASASMTTTDANAALTLSGGITQPGELWTCEITPSDGTGSYGVPGSSQVTVLQTETICTFTVNDPSSADSTTCSYTVPAIGVIRYTLDNPDESRDGVFTSDIGVGGGSMYLFTGTRSWAYRGPTVNGWTDQDVEQNVDGSLGTLNIQLSYGPEGGSDNTGPNSVTVEFVPGLQLDTSSASFLDSNVVCGDCTNISQFSVTLSAGERLLVEATHCGGGDGAHALYADDNGTSGDDGITKIYTGSSATCSRPLRSLSIDPGTYLITLVNEDDHWVDNVGTRGISVYRYTP